MAARLFMSSAHNLDTPAGDYPSAIFRYFSMNGVVAATSTALDEAGEFAGSASAPIGALQYGSGIISSLLLAWLHDGAPWTMVRIMAAFTGTSLLVVWTRAQAA